MPAPPAPSPPVARPRVVGVARAWMFRVACAAVVVVVPAAGCGSTPTSGYVPPPVKSEAAAPRAGTPSRSVPSGDPPSAAPTPSRTARPRFAFPKDFKVVVQAETPPARAAGAVRTFREFWQAWWYAVTTQGRDRRYLEYIAPGADAYGTGLFARVVGDWARENVRPTGVVRARAVQALQGDGPGVTLVGCGDETRAGTRNLTTGQVSWTFGQHDTSRYKIRIMMVPGPGGGWLIRAYQSVPVTSPSGRECR
ncbi:hypothetical protein [Microbispora sp. NPDC049125]|uniref:hypothetical protein n=1 Tax=Microbispora sp. NPDC049125 TaxID=3154929 RepID=UPI003466E6FB